MTATSSSRATIPSAAETMTKQHTIAVVGHESDDGRGLRALLVPSVSTATPGRELYQRVAEARGRGERVCVVPMTLGRDPELVADAARTLRSLCPEDRKVTVLASSFGTTGHLIGWLRASATKVATDTALLVVAPTGDPFSDAELFRVARLVRQYARHRTVEVALIGGDPDPREGRARCVALGADEVAVLLAGWPAVPPVDDALPLLTPTALAGVLASRVHEAWHRLDHGDDGVERGLAKAHGHGYAHSHGPGDDHDHGPGDAHSHGPGEPHSHGAGVFRSPSAGEPHSHGVRQALTHGQSPGTAFHAHSPSERTSESAQALAR